VPANHTGACYADMCGVDTQRRTSVLRHGNRILISLLSRVGIGAAAVDDNGFKFFCLYLSAHELYRGGFDKILCEHPCCCAICPDERKPGFSLFYPPGIHTFDRTDALTVHSASAPVFPGYEDPIALMISSRVIIPTIFFARRTGSRAIPSLSMRAAAASTSISSDAVTTRCVITFFTGISPIFRSACLVFSQLIYSRIGTSMISK